MYQFLGYFCSERVECIGTQYTMYYQERGDFLVMGRNTIAQAKSNFILWPTWHAWKDKCFLGGDKTFPSLSM